jgi:hypothetical protein
MRRRRRVGGAPRGSYMPRAGQAMHRNIGKGREEAQRGGSSKGGGSVASQHGAQWLRGRTSDDGGIMSFPMAWRLLGTCR